MTKQDHKLSFLQFTLMIFALTSGGPFGIETAIQSGGILLTLIGLIIIPIVYSIPQSLMCSELGSMMPSHHGYIVWSFRAFKNEGKFGEFLGFYNAIGCTLAMAKDIPIYITVMLFYFQQFFALNFDNFDMTFTQQYLFKFIIIMIGAIFNIFNITTLGNSNLILMIIVFVPFIAGFIYTLPETSWNNISASTPYNENKEYQLGLWLSTLLWCHTGWDTVGCLTADISFNKNKIILAFIFAVILDYISYTIPILGAITQPCDNDTTCWENGYLYVAYNKISPWLGLLVIIAGFVSNFGIYISEMAVQARTYWALSQPRVILKDDQMYVESADGTIYDGDMNIIHDFDSNADDLEKLRIGMLPRWLCGTLNSKTGAPIRGVILQSLICSILIVFDFSFLLQATVLINCITWCIELCSFLRLRYSEPDAARPYKVPGGKFVAWLITIDKIILVLVLLILVLMDNPSYAWVTISSFILSLLWFIIYSWNIKQKEIKNKLHTDLDKIDIKITQPLRSNKKIKSISIADGDCKRFGYNYGSIIQ